MAICVWKPNPTEREVSVIQLTAEGMQSSEIALKLRLSETTVKTHLKKAMGRLGAANRAQLVAVAMRKGYIK